MDTVRAGERTFLMEPEAYEVMEAYGFPVVRSKLAFSSDEAAAAAEKIGRW